MLWVSGSGRLCPKHPDLMKQENPSPQGNSGTLLNLILDIKLLQNQVWISPCVSKLNESLADIVSCELS